MSNVSLVNGHIDRPKLTDNEIPKQRIKAIYPHITVGGTIDNPCYSIDWYDVDENMMHSGFTSYNLKFVRKWLEEEFEVVEADIDNLIKRQKAEIERLQNSIKEADNYFSKGEMGKGLAVIINLVKEMVGDEK